MKKFCLLQIMLIALLMIGTGRSALAQGPAELKIVSDPPGAKVLLDNKDTGLTTPCTIKELQSGRHTVELRKVHYRPDRQEIQVQPGANKHEVSMAETSPYYMWLSLPSLLLGALMTLFLTMVAVFNGVCIGTLLGVARVIHNKIMNFLSAFYVNCIRGTPLLVQIFMIHFGLPPVLGAIFNHGQAIPINPFVSALSALSINSGAYVAEIIRAGIQSIDRGQMEAARSLGMTYRQSMRHIVLPQALKRVIPPLGNEFIAMLKDSSLVSVIGMEELVRKAQVIVTRSYRPTETWIEVGLIFLFMTLPFTWIVAKLERRLKIGD